MKYSFFLFLFSTLLFSQTHKEKFTLSQNYIYLANLDFYKKDYKLATKKFKEAFKIHKANDSYDILNAAASGFKSGDNKFARKKVIESITKYAAPKDFVLEYDKYKDFNSDLIFKEIEKNYDFYINEYFRNLKNPHAYFEVQKLVEKDQNIRNLSNDIKNRIKHDKKNMWKLDSIFNTKMVEVDLETTKSLIELTKKYGYQDNAWLILWHQRGPEYKDGNTEFWKYFKPVIEKEIQNGKLHESFFGQFDDENELRNGKQIYGYYLFQVQMYPIADIENVDYKRKKIGLPPLLYDKLIYGMSLPQEYSLSEKELYEELLRRIK
jgi:hypothetical protein